MKWAPLELSNLAEVEKQVAEVVKTHDALVTQLEQRRGNSVQVSKALEVLRSSILQRAHLMERFYQENDLDPRSSRVEASRLKLKKVLKTSGLDLGTEGSGTPPATPEPPKSQKHPAKKGNASSSSGTRSGGGAGGGGGEKVVLKIQMTHSEFEQLRARREAVKALKGKGSGSMAWEQAYTAKRVDTTKEGVSTFHEIPYVDPMTAKQGGEIPLNESGKPFRVTGGRREEPHPGFISTGKYTSANPEVAGATQRFTTLHDEMTGGKRAVDSSQPFNAVVGSTRVSSSLHKAEPLGRR